MRVLFVFLCLTISAAAGPIDWLYVYPCDSGVFDCSTFQHHDYGTTDYSVIQPVTGNPEFDAQWGGNFMIASNHSDEAIGCGFYVTGCATVYGAGGATSLVTPGPDLGASSGDINEAGHWIVVYNGGGGQPVDTGIGTVVVRLDYSNVSEHEQSFVLYKYPELATGPLFDIYLDEAYALNEMGDVFVRYSTVPYGSGPSFNGVFSARPIPEPATLPLSLGGLALIILSSVFCRRDKASGGQQVQECR